MKTRMDRVDPRSLKLLELNARFMRHEQYQQLVANIKRDGCLTSVPLVCIEDGVQVVRSGNHRVRASIDAGLLEIDVMVVDEPLTEAQLIALQLSHNSIAGEDDPAILKQLYQQIEDVDWRQYAGLDDKTLELLDEIDVDGLSEANLEFQTIAFVFLPNEAERAKEAFDEARAMVSSNATWLARFAEVDRLYDALAEASASSGVKNQAVALLAVLDVFAKHRDSLRELWDAGDGEVKHDGRVPLSSVYGTDRIPAALAAKLGKHVDKLLAQGEIDNAERWRALEHLK